MVRTTRTEKREPESVIKKPYISQERAIEQILDYSNAGDDKKKNNRLPLSADSVTSTGETISLNGIRLWGMW